MHFSMLIRAFKLEQLMGQRNQGIFRIEKRLASNRLLAMTIIRLIAIKYCNRLTALIYIYINIYVRSNRQHFGVTPRWTDHRDGPS